MNSNSNSTGMVQTGANAGKTTISKNFQRRFSIGKPETRSLASTGSNASGDRPRATLAQQR